MKSESILLINHYAGTPTHGMEFRPYYMAKRWVRMGYHVIIIAASHTHVRKSNPEIRGPVTRETIDGITYLWLKTPAYSGNGAARVLNMCVFVYRVFRLRHRLGGIYRLRAVIASSTYPMDIFPAYLIARRAHARLIFEVHDLWPLSPIELGGYSRYHPFILVMQWAENFAYNKSHTVVSMLPKTLPHMVRHGLDPNKFVYIPNGIEIEDTFNDDHASGAVLAGIPDDKFIVGYAGTLGIANSLDCLLQAADVLRDMREIHFVLVGGGPESRRLIKMASDLGLRNVTFAPPVERTQVLSVIRWFDVCFIGWKRKNLYRFGVSPNKIFDYMHAARPILQAIEAGNDPVRDAGCGISVEPENPTAIADAIVRFYRAPRDALSTMGARGKQFVMMNHSYERLAQKFAILFAAPTP